MKKLVCIFLFTMGLVLGRTYSQEAQKMMTNEEVVEKFLNGFNDITKIKESLALLEDDYKFKNPMVQLDTKAEFIVLAQEMGKVLTEVNVLKTAENEDWVVVMYEFRSSVPGLERNLATEWFRVKNGMIKESQLIYDASKWRKFYQQINE